MIVPKDRTITITPVDPPGAGIKALLGDGEARFSYDGGWTFVSRPRQRAGTEWVGVDGFALKIPITFEAYRTEGSIEGFVQRLIVMMRNRVGSRVEPPVVKLTSAAIPPFPDLRWVIQGMEEKRSMRRPDGLRSYAEFDMTFMEYTALDVLVTKKPTPAAKAKTVRATAGKAAGKAKTYTVKSGDTLAVIAARNGIKKWQDIASLNGIRDPRAVPVGKVLKLP